MFKTPLKIEWLVDQSKGFNTRVKVLDALVWDDGTYNITVPDGFISDLTTLWPEGKHSRCSVMHDYLTTKKKNWGFANRVFKKSLKADGVGFIMRNIMVAGVQLNRFKYWVFG